MSAIDDVADPDVFAPAVEFGDVDDIAESGHGWEHGRAFCEVERADVGAEEVAEEEEFECA